MSKKLYNWIVSLAFFLYRLFSLFSKRGKAFFSSRKMNPSTPDLDQSILFHCASLGEYEESKPVIERIHQVYPNIPVVVSFFSNSGFDHLKRKNHELITYLPIDSFGGYEDFLDKLSPKLVYISKYEFWPGFFEALHDRNIPIVHINTTIKSTNWIFRKPLLTFLPIFRKATYFTANKESAVLLLAYGFQNVKTGVDLRMNRALQLPNEASEFLWFRDSIEKPLIIFGSTWPADEELIIPFIQAHPEFQYIIAPHDIGNSHVSNICNQLPDAKLWSNAPNDSWHCIVVDSIGELKYLYQFADIAYIGGGIHHKVHNFLEASAYLIPTVIGENHTNMPIAYTMIKEGFTTAISTYSELENTLLNHRFSTSDKENLNKLFHKSKDTLQEILRVTKKFLS